MRKLWQFCKLLTRIRPVASVQFTQMGPEDILILTYKEDLSEDELRGLKIQWNGLFPNIRCAIFAKNPNIQVLRRVE